MALLMLLTLLMGSSTDPEPRSSSDDRAVTVALILATLLALLRVVRASRERILDGEFALAMAFLLLGSFLLGSELYERLTRRS